MVTDNIAISNKEAAADDLVAQADTGARSPSGMEGRLIIAICIIWSLYQLFIASSLPGWLTINTGIQFTSVVGRAVTIYPFSFCSLFSYVRISTI